MASIDTVIKALQTVHDDIDDDVDGVLSKSAENFETETKDTARDVMNKGYWTGNLMRMVEATKSGNLEYEIVSNAHYSGFLEYGTRYMAPETFMFPVYEKYTKKVRADLKKLIN